MNVHINVLSYVNEHTCICACACVWYVCMCVAWVCGCMHVNFHVHIMSDIWVVPTTMILKITIAGSHKNLRLRDRLLIFHQVVLSRELHTDIGWVKYLGQSYWIKYCDCITQSWNMEFVSQMLVQWSDITLQINVTIFNGFYSTLNDIIVIWPLLRYGQIIKLNKLQLDGLWKNS